MPVICAVPICASAIAAEAICCESINVAVPLCSVLAALSLPLLSTAVNLK